MHTCEIIRFAVIGDYGDDSADEGRVATMVNAWNLDFIITRPFPPGTMASMRICAGHLKSGGQK